MEYVRMNVYSAVTKFTTKWDNESKYNTKKDVLRFSKGIIRAN